MTGAHICRHSGGWGYACRISRQVLLALPTDLAGVSSSASTELVGLTASRTGPLHCSHVQVPHELVLAGPVAEVMKTGAGAQTGGLQTSILAAGLAASALDYIEVRRLASGPSLERLRMRYAASGRGSPMICSDPLKEVEICSNEAMRTRANSHVLRATQAALAAAKGTGYVAGHAAGRWCREALFFLVWSCPQPVLSANLCELAGIGGS